MRDELLVLATIYTVQVLPRGFRRKVAYDQSRNYRSNTCPAKRPRPVDQLDTPCGMRLGSARNKLMLLPGNSCVTQIIIREEIRRVGLLTLRISNNLQISDT